MKIMPIALVMLLAVALAGCFHFETPEKLNFNFGGRADDEAKTKDADTARGQDDALEGHRDDEDDDGDKARSDSADIIVSDEGWPDTVFKVGTAVALGAEHGALFYAYDTLAYPKQRIKLNVRLQSAKDLRGYSGVTVTFYKGEESIGSAKTNEAGLAALGIGPLAAGDHRFTARITAVPRGTPRELLDIQETPLLVAARTPQDKFVVVDLDRTVVGSSFLRVLTGIAKPMPHAWRVMQRIAKDYHVIYLTHRPEQLTRKSKQWLGENDFPTGPLLVAGLAKLADSGKYKSGRVAAIRCAFPRASVGIGDKISDAEAYLDNDMTAYLVPHYKAKPKDMRKLARQIRRLPNDQGLNVVSGWREIEVDLFFTDETYSPTEFARRLEQKADEIERRKKLSDQEDD